MDLTKIDKPFGELNDTTKGALLLAHHLGEVIEYTTGSGWKVPLYVAWSDVAIYRVQPKPVIGEVVLSGVGPVYHSLHPMCIGKEYKLHITFPTIDEKYVPGVYTSPNGMQINIEVTE